MGEGYVSFYEGGYSSFDPQFSPIYGNFTGYRMDASQLSSTTSVQSANQVSEVLSRIREGVKNVELQPLASGVLDTVSEEQLKEIHALMKLTGVKPSFHAPIEDPSGFTERGFEGETARQEVERRFIHVLEKAKTLSPNENIPVVFHASSIPGSEYIKGDVSKGEPKFKEVEGVVVNKETGQLLRVQEERKYFPEYVDNLSSEKKLEEQGKVYDIKKKIEEVNSKEWRNLLTEILHREHDLQEYFIKGAAAFDSYSNLEDEKEKKLREKLWGPYKERAKDFSRFLDDALRNLFHKAYEYGTEEQRKKLIQLAKNWQEEEKKLSNIQDENKRLIGQREIFIKKINDLKEVTWDKPPQIYAPIEEVALENAAKTFGNVAFEGYKKWKDSAPIIAIENLYPGMAFSRSDELKKIIELARENFVKNAVKEGLDEKEARKKAESLIGATWDVGHLNIMKKKGFSDKDIIEETKKIRELVKHVHLTDNFGFNDSHLAPGMGNVPIKEILKELEKNGEFDKMMKVIEAGGLTNPNLGLRASPFKATLGAFGPAMYPGGPYWNQIENVHGNYFGFPLAYMPEKHFSLYGSSFSSLPEELGGQIPGSTSRFSGTPTA
ncbi:MAG: hypothetical protein QW273_01295 [Candidatus Pacearchaeota archaeon]